VAERNLKLALPDLDAAQRRRILRGMYRHLGLSLAEFLRISTWTAEKVAERITFDRFDRLRDAISGGRGVVVITAHFGNWDLLQCVAARIGVPLHVVTRELKGRRTNRAWMQMRAAMGVRLHAATGSANDLLRALRSGEVVAFVIDQHMPEKLGVPVPFFGRLASTIDAPAVLAARTGAPVHPAFLFREGFERHRLWIGPAIPLAAGRRREGVTASTALFTRALEDAVRERPEQWIWVHRRWKSTDRVLAGRAVSGEAAR
jgi:KDO2-lipid IV(A) lauroyltransferase